MRFTTNNDEFQKIANKLDLNNKFGISKEEYNEIHKTLTVEYHMNIIRTHFIRPPETRFARTDKHCIKPNLTQHTISFQLLCNEFIKRGIDIRPLIHEFNEAQKNPEIGQINHTFTLGKLAYEYIIYNYDLEFSPQLNDFTNPDLKINGITADLKVREEVDFNLRFLEEYKIAKFESGKKYVLKTDPQKELIEDMYGALGSRWSSQAEMFFIDLTDKWGEISKNVSTENVVRPIRNSWIFFKAEHTLSKIRSKFTFAQIKVDVEKADFMRKEDGSLYWMKLR